MGLHSDDEPELGLDPVIASISLGARRDFQLSYKTDKSKKLDLSLGHGSLVIMACKMQSHWRHGLPKRLRVSEPRVNLTFRMIAYFTESGHLIQADVGLRFQSMSITDSEHDDQGG